MDDDLRGMSREALVAEAGRLRAGIRRHRDSTGQELCWHHPALWGLLPEATDPVPQVPDWAEFLRGCIRYRQSLDVQAPHAATKAADGSTLQGVAIRALRAGDEAVLGHVAPGVFDDPIVPHATETFLADPRHHLVVALEDGLVVGFASGVHSFHPDKAAPELFVNEVGVSPTHQGRGVGKAVVGGLLQVAREHGCREAWVLTDRSNAAALRLYAASGGTEAPHDQVMFSFALESPL